jgi:hypothetical protein
MRADQAERESVLFIGTQFSILYTSMYSPAEAATCYWRVGARAPPLFLCWPAPRHTHTQSRPKDYPFQHQVTTPMPPSKLNRAEPSCSIRWDAGVRVISTKLMSCE